MDLLLEIEGSGIMSNVIITPALAWRIEVPSVKYCQHCSHKKIYSSIRYCDFQSPRMADLTCLIADVSVQMDAFCSQMPHNHCFVLSYSLRVNLSISHLIFFFFFQCQIGLLFSMPHLNCFALNPMLWRLEIIWLINV